MEGESDSREGVAQRGRTERRRVTGQLAVWLVGSLQKADGLALTNLSMSSLSSKGIYPQTGAMRWGTSRGIRTVPQVTGNTLEKQGDCIPRKIATSTGGYFLPTNVDHSHWI